MESWLQTKTRSRIPCSMQAARRHQRAAFVQITASAGGADAQQNQVARNFGSGQYRRNFISLPTNESFIKYFHKG